MIDIITLSLLIVMLFGDRYLDKRDAWNDWKREVWKLNHPSQRRNND